MARRNGKKEQRKYEEKLFNTLTEIVSEVDKGEKKLNLKITLHGRELIYSIPVSENFCSNYTKISKLREEAKKRTGLNVAVQIGQKTGGSIMLG